MLLSNSLCLSHLSWFSHMFILSLLSLLFVYVTCLIVWAIFFGPSFVCYETFDLECLWTFFPLLFVCLMFLPLVWYSPLSYQITYFLTAEQWFFTYSHLLPTLSLLLGISNDVIHAFFLPELWVKMDLVPGQITPISLVFPFTGVYRVYCAQICGTNHSVIADYLLVY